MAERVSGCDLAEIKAVATTASKTVVDDVIISARILLELVGAIELSDADWQRVVNERDAARADYARMEQECKAEEARAEVAEGYFNDAERGLRATISRLETALGKINEIRNSIIGLQTINWSEHIYPLVAALNEAGMEGMDYDEARGKFGTMLERTNAAEDRADAATAAERERCAVLTETWADKLILKHVAAAIRMGDA